MSRKLNVEKDCPLDILHLAFGGLGGHRAVTEELSKAMGLGKLRSGVVYLAPTNVSQKEVETSCLELVRSIRIRHRADFSSMFEVARVVWQLNPRCIVAHTYRHIPAAWLGMALRFKKPKILMVEHQSINLRNHLDELQSIIGALFSVAVVFLSKTYEESFKSHWFIRILHRRTAIIPNGIEIPSSPKRTLHLDPFFTVGMAARLVASKKVSNLIEAIALLNSRGNPLQNNWFLRVAGDGPERERLLVEISQRGLGSSVQLDGPLARSEMSNWYCSLDLYVHVSEGETMSMSILEAASYGLPIATNDDPTIRQIFQDGRSIVLLPSSDPNIIATFLERLRSSDDLDEMGVAARLIVEENFTNQIMAKSYLELLRSVNALPESLVADAIAGISSLE